MKDEAAFLQAMLANPEDNDLRLVFADWLEEWGDPRGEFIRLLHTLTQSIEVPDRSKLEDRLRNLAEVWGTASRPFLDELDWDEVCLDSGRNILDGQSAR